MTSPEPTEVKLPDPEKQFAIKLANCILDNASRDPDGDLSILSRQFLRALGTSTPSPSVTAALAKVREALDLSIINTDNMEIVSMCDDALKQLAIIEAQIKGAK